MCRSFKPALGLNDLSNLSIKLHKWLDGLADGRWETRPRWEGGEERPPS